MTDFKHIREQIDAIGWAECHFSYWEDHGDSAKHLAALRRAKQAMQALLERNKLLEDVAEAAQRVRSPGAMSSAYIRLDDALAKLQEQK
jgi:hypothetical protein